MSEGLSISREELLELAVADAIGVLDEVDTARFERAFSSAVPSLQAEVRVAQDRVALDRMLLVDEQPPASLRLKTLARVAAAIELEAAGAAPIAMIGPARGHTAERASVVASAVAGSDSSPREFIDHESREAIVREILERSAMERRPPQHLWRAAALFLFAALVVALYFHSEQRAISERMMNFVDGRLSEDAMRAIGRATSGFDFEHARQLKVYVKNVPDNAGATGIALRDGPGGGSGVGSLLVDPANESKLVHAYFDESRNQICVIGFGVSESGKPVIVTRVDEQKALPLVAGVVEHRGFCVLFAAPPAKGELTLRLGASELTIVV
jgi:hypothetical protein